MSDSLGDPHRGDDKGSRPHHAAPNLADALLYGPLGLVLEARTLMPRLVERGRNQVALARMMGSFAVRKGSEDLAAVTMAVSDRLVGIARGSGLVPPADPPSPQTPVTAAAGQQRPAAPRVSAEAAAAAVGIEVTDLAIPGYDLLSASQVVPRLDSLTPDELTLVGRYEAGTRGRKTILSKVAQLRAGNPEGA